MAIKTQGTDLFALVPSTGEIIDVGCLTSIDGLDVPLDQIETTCLNQNVRTYEAGLGTPGTGTFAINTDYKDSSHVRLTQLKGVNLEWAIGFRQDDAFDPVSPAPRIVPTSALQSDGSYSFVLPDERGWLVFDGYMSSFSYAFAQNAVVNSSIGIQVSGDITMIPAVETPVVSA